MKNKLIVGIIFGMIIVGVILAINYIGNVVSVTTDKSEYNRGESVQIFIENKLNEPLRIGVESGCEGTSYVISKYENGDWIDFPETCGVCEMEINILLNPKETKMFEWDQTVYFNRRSCSESNVSSGQYRIKIKYGKDDVKISYSSTITIK